MCFVAACAVGFWGVGIQLSLVPTTESPGNVWKSFYMTWQYSAVAMSFSSILYPKIAIAVASSALPVRCGGSVSGIQLCLHCLSPGCCQGADFPCGAAVHWSLCPGPADAWWTNIRQWLQDGSFKGESLRVDLDLNSLLAVGCHRWQQRINVDLNSKFRSAADKWFVGGSLWRDECSGCWLKAAHVFFRVSKLMTAIFGGKRDSGERPMNCLHFQRNGFYSHCNAAVRNLRGLFKPALQMRSLQELLEKLMQWKRELRLFYSTFWTRCRLNPIFFSLMKCCAANDRKTFSFPSLSLESFVFQGSWSSWWKLEAALA